MKKYVSPIIHNYGNLSVLIQQAVKRTGPPDILARHRLIG
jgi:hypothetical protein